MEPIDYARLAIKRPDDFGYWGGNDELFVTWGITGPHQTRDSDVLERSNYRVIKSDLMERFPDDFEEFQASHWAVGWVDSLTCRIFDKQVYECPSCHTVFKNDPEKGMSFKTEFEQCPICRAWHVDEGYQTEDGITPAFLALLEWKENLESYAVADDMDYSELEHEELISEIKFALGVDEEVAAEAAFYMWDELNACRWDELTSEDYLELEKRFGENDA